MATSLGQKRKRSTRLRSTKNGPVRDTTYEFLVRADDAYEPEAAIEAATGLSLNTFAVGLGFVKSLSSTNDDANATLWTVTAEISTELEDDSNSDGDGNDDPTAWTPVYRTQFERIQEVSTTDVNGDTIANSAGQPFPNGITIARYIPIWDLYQFEAASVTDETIIGRNEVVNSGVFKGRGVKTLLCTVVTSEIGYYYGRLLRFTNYQLRYNSKKWTDKRDDVGTVYKDGSSLKAYLDADSNVILGPLDGSTGAKASAGDPAGVIEFDIYPSASFSFLRT